MRLIIAFLIVLSASVNSYAESSQKQNLVNSCMKFNLRNYSLEDCQCLAATYSNYLGLQKDKEMEYLFYEIIYSNEVINDRKQPAEETGLNAYHNEKQDRTQLRADENLAEQSCGINMLSINKSFCNDYHKQRNQTLEQCYCEANELERTLNSQQEENVQIALIEMSYLVKNKSNYPKHYWDFNMRAAQKNVITSVTPRGDFDITDKIKNAQEACTK